MIGCPPPKVGLIKNWIRSSDNDLLILEAPRLQKLGMPGCHNLLKSLWKQIELIEKRAFHFDFDQWIFMLFRCSVNCYSFQVDAPSEPSGVSELEKSSSTPLFQWWIFSCKMEKWEKPIADRVQNVQKVHVQNAKCALSCWSLADREKSGGKNSRCLANCVLDA